MKRFIILICLLITTQAFAFDLGFNMGFGGGGGSWHSITSTLTWSPTSHDYGSQNTGTNTDYSYTLTGSNAEEISLAVSGTGYSLLSTTCGSNPFDLNGTCTATVRFTPASAGSLSGNLTASWTNRDDVVASLSGTGVANYTYPESGDVVLGANDSSGYTGTHMYGVGNGELYNYTGLAGAWSATSPTTTIGTIYAFYKGWGSGNAKMVLRDSNLNLVAVSNTVAVSSEDTTTYHAFTFATPPEIIKGDTYHPTIIFDTDYVATIGKLTSGEDRRASGVASTFTSIPSALTMGDNLWSPGIGAFYAVH